MMSTVTDTTRSAPPLIDTSAESAATTNPVRFRLFEDAAGGYWKVSYVPVDAVTVTTLQQWHNKGMVDLEVTPLPESEFRAAEMAWLQEHHVELSREYPGFWIAIDGTELVAAAPDLLALLQIARDRGHPHPFVTALPADPDMRLYF